MDNKDEGQVQREAKEADGDEHDITVIADGADVLGPIGRNSRKWTKVAADAALYDAFAPEYPADVTQGHEQGPRAPSSTEILLEQAASYELGGYNQFRNSSHSGGENLLAEFWRENAKLRWPLLAQMALSIHALPAGTASIERMFSFSGDMVKGKTNRLGPAMLDYQMMVGLNKEFV
jgi:hypothetical protein